ncbi:UDP-N-acetylglucosamine 2-epimerase [Pseudarthrobacter sp. S6]|uniref:UDP-N-acetylglucosamine 2-epimerase n=1 Tax=Pseudarthrobacter sp. S6 TaxID=3418420 RepID=UPI003CF19498
MKVLAFIGSRADLFPLGPVLERLANGPLVELHIVSAVGFEDGDAEIQLHEAGLRPGSFLHHSTALHLGQASPQSQTTLGPMLSAKIADLILTVKPEALVVLGDRWELLYVVPPAVLHGLRVIHLHGGEVTEGAMDERVRHAVTKLADQHCVSTEGAARRVSQLGEPPHRIHQTGAPGLDRLAKPLPLSAQEFSSAFGRSLIRPLLLVTYHPETARETGAFGSAARVVYEESVAAAGTAILTYPGYDAGRDEIVQALLKIDTGPGSGVIVTESLGALYPRVLATVDAVVGNSSSGIIEAASFAVPVVNVGDRQKGREHGVNVIHSTHDSLRIRSSIEMALSREFKRTCSHIVNPYGDSMAAERIETVIASSGAASLAKSFIDISAGESNHE